MISEKAMLRKIVLVTILLAVAGYYIVNRSDVIASWHMINVNYGPLQGDANLIVTGDVSVMIDAGYALEARTEVLPYLKKLGIKKSTIFLSHTLIETTTKAWHPS